MANEMRDRKINQTKNPIWLPLIHQAIDQTTGEVIRKYPNGYTCSRCGKHSWSKKEICDGCNSTMEQDGIRNRIVELLRQKTCIYASCDRECSGCGNISISDSDIEIIADYLIENDVVVLLCKVGDRVYQTDGVRIYELEVLDISIYKNMPYYETESIDFDTRAIGTSIFLTKSEAEQKLKEMRKEDEGK